MPLSDRGPRLIVQFGGRRLAHPFPLPPQFPSPCAYVAALGQLMSADRRFGTWYVDPGRPRNPGNVGPGTPAPPEAP
jgi:hypothetical protein